MQTPRPFHLKTLAWFLTIFALFLFAATNAAAEFGSVKKDGVNIRSAPNTKAEILWEVFKDFPLEILQRQGKWAKIKDFEGDTGWIYAPLLSKNKTVIVKAKSINMRVGAGKNYEILATVKYGVVFDLVKQEGDWAQMKHEDGTTGWIHSSLIWPQHK